MFYAYIYRDTRPHKNNEPIYVGKGCKDRSSIHMYGSHNPHLAAKINKMKAIGLAPSVEIIEAIDEDHAFFLEECLIEVIGRIDLKLGPLTNMTNGGEGVSGVVISANARAKMSAAKLGKPSWNKGKEWSAGVRAKVSLGLTGKTASAETKAKMSATRTGKVLSPRTAEHAANNAASQRGKKASPETRAKMAESQRRRHAERKLQPAIHSRKTS